MALDELAGMRMLWQAYEKAKELNPYIGEKGMELARLEYKTIIDTKNLANPGLFGSNWESAYK